MSKKAIGYKYKLEDNDVYVADDDGSAILPDILPGVSAIASPATRDMFNEPDQDPTSIETKKKEYKIINWGEDNNLPNQIIDKIGKSEVLSAGLYFNAFTGYGQGLVPCYYDYSTKTPTVKHYYYKGIELKKEMRRLQLEEIELSNTDKKDKTAAARLDIVQEDLKEVKEKYNNWKKTIKELKDFLKYNDVNHQIDEQLIDLNFFFMAVPMIVLNDKKKVVRIKHREAAFSRWEERNDKGKVEHMLYSWRWHETSQIEEKDVIPYKVLDPDSPLADLESALGIKVNDKGTKKDTNERKFIVPLPLPSPGRFYYPKSPWYAVFLSGWYDIATKVPQAKNAIMDNVMALGYHIELSPDYFKEIFKEENITDQKKKKARIKAEYKKLNDFLSGKENMGKSLVSFVTYDNEGKEKRRMKITAIDNPYKEGGNYIEDSEEASNMMDQAMWVHPSIIGASPGKSKNINGTEARELFIMKNAGQKPFRDRVVKPYYLAKHINGWDDELEWMIPNMELAKLDENTGSKKVVS